MFFFSATNARTNCTCLCESFQTAGLLVNCLLQQFVPGSWIPGGVSPLWLVRCPLTSRWMLRDFMLLWMMFICTSGILGGRASLPQECSGAGRGGRGRYYMNVDEMGTPRSWTDSNPAAAENSQWVLTAPVTHLLVWSSPDGTCEGLFVWWQGGQEGVFLLLLF